MKAEAWQMVDFDALWLTLRVAGWATLWALLGGTAMGFLVARSRFPGRQLLDALLMLPLVLPPTVLGYYLIVTLGRRSLLGRWLAEGPGIELIFTTRGAVVAAAVVAFPLVFKAARAAFEEVDRQLEQAARSAPARPRCSCASPCPWRRAASRPAPCWPSPAPWASSAPR